MTTRFWYETLYNGTSLLGGKRIVRGENSIPTTTVIQHGFQWDKTGRIRVGGVSLFP